MKYKLLKVEHYEKGKWYFTSVYKVANALDTQATHINYYMGKNKEYKGWNFEWIDGENVIYKYINPEKI